MGILDSLFTGQAPTQGSTAVTQKTMPGWYQDMVRGIAAQGVQAAAQPRPVYSGQQIAGLTPSQQQAIDLTRSGVGAWQPGLQGAQQTAAGVPGMAQLAQTAVAGPAAQWPQQYQQYMSPYTSSVVDEIARLGTRNLSEQLLPAVSEQFIGAGGFGSTRNAEILGRVMRDVGADIAGQQARALESGYGTAAGIFGQDAARQQQQQQLQAQMALSGGQLGLSAAQQQGALAQLGQGLQAGDVSALGAAGALQQAQQQRILDAQYRDFQEAQGYDWQQLGQLSGLVKGMDVPSITTQTATSGGTAGSPSALQWLSYIGALGQGATPATPPKP